MPAARRIVHIVGPVWRGGNQGEENLLRSCFREIFQIASRHGLCTIAFPAISAGAYGFPVKQAASTAIGDAPAFLAAHPARRTATFVCFSEKDGKVFDRALRLGLSKAMPDFETETGKNRP